MNNEIAHLDKTVFVKVRQLVEMEAASLPVPVLPVVVVVRVAELAKQKRSWA